MVESQSTALTPWLRSPYVFTITFYGQIFITSNENLLGLEPNDSVELSPFYADDAVQS